MPRCASVLAGLVLAGLSSAVAAADWLCTLSEDLVQLVCVADTDPLRPVSAPAATQAVVNGVAFPLDDTQEYRVPLWTPPSDPEWVAQLARATICFRSPGCTVTLAPATWAALSRPAYASVRVARRR